MPPSFGPDVLPNNLVGHSIYGGRVLGTRIPQNERGCLMKDLLAGFWRDDRGQDVAEYAVMLAVILVIVVGTIRMVGSQSNNVFSNAASSIQ